MTIKTIGRLLAAVVLLAAFGGTAAFGQTWGRDGTTNVTLNVGVEASIRIRTPTTELTTAGGFAEFLGSTGFSYKIRTQKTGGKGDITLQITSDFSPADGPSVAKGDKLTYACAIESPGLACSGSQTSSTTVATAVATFGTNAHSTINGNDGNVSWTLTNDPKYATDSYQATATFTISAT